MSRSWLTAVVVTGVVASACGGFPSAPPSTPIPGSARHAYSRNPYFPADLGDTWTYRITSGPPSLVGTTETQSITGATPVADGIAVAVHTVVTSPQTPPVTVDAKYLFHPDGTVRLDLGTISVQGVGGTITATGQSSGAIVIPTAAQIRAGTPVSGRDTFTIALPSGSQTATLEETARGVGTVSVHEAGRDLSAAKLHLDLTISVSAAGKPVTVPLTVDLYLAPGVGMVREEVSSGPGSGEVVELVSSNLLR